MKILVAAVGSHGDVLPMIALAREFRSRGYEVCLYTSAYFAPYAEAAGIRLRALGTPEEYVELLNNPDLIHPIRGHRSISAAIERNLPRMYLSMSADVERGDTIVIGSILAFPARLLQDTHDVPCVIVHLSPTTVRSTFETPRMTPFDPGPYLPRWLKEVGSRALDRWVLDPLYAAALNRYRRSLGLAPVRSVLDRWVNGAAMLLGLFPEWFAAPQPDWPRNLRQTGFPLYDQSGSELPPEVREFLESGGAPIGFTAGTATASARDFFSASAAACALLGRRGILLTHRPEQIPADLPPGVVHFGYVPFADLLPRLTGFVHHGGIGTTSQALRAGIPQLIRPMAYDQLDNSRRVERLGVARELLPSRYDSRRAADALDRLLRDPALRDRCQHWATRLAHSDTNSEAVSRSCDLILQSFAPGQRR